jgi:hypothetical protein
MFIDKPTSDLTKKFFTKGSLFVRSKKKMLDKANGYQDESLFLSITAFTALINTFENETGYTQFEVDFAIYDAASRPNTFPQLDHDNKLILLFYPYGTSDQNYYFVNADVNYYTLPKVIGDKWTQKYVDNCDSKYLTKTIRKKDSDNYMPKSNEFSDTRKIFYIPAAIHDAFICEPVYQKKIFPQNEVTGIQLTFSRYSKKGRFTDDPSKTKDVYRKRLFVQFDLTKKGPNGSDVVFYLDTDPDEAQDYQRRRECTIQKVRALQGIQGELSVKQKNDLIRMLGLDNGQLCPTVCN